MNNEQEQKNHRPTLEQKRAQHAWNAVQEMKENEKSKEEGRETKKMPVRIITAGLGQSLAFLEAKKNGEILRRKLSDWINQRIPAKESDLLNRIKDGDSDFLRRATDEAMAYLQWLVRFAEAERLTDE